jgi:phage terminase small subunit
MNDYLTVKQNNFCQHYQLTGNASEAYRMAYNATNMKTETIHRKATEVMANGKVAARIRELQRQAQTNFEITLDSQVSRYMQLLSAAGTEIEEPRHRIDSMTRILARLDKICGLESNTDNHGTGGLTIIMDEKDLLA